MQGNYKSLNGRGGGRPEGGDGDKWVTELAIDQRISGGSWCKLPCQYISPNCEWYVGYI